MYELAVILPLFVIGSCVGSLLSVLIYRLPRETALASRSYCPKCEKSIQLVDMIPVLSWVERRGKCRNCSESISVRYPIIEVVSGVVFSGIFIHYFKTDFIQVMPSFFDSGWVIYLIHIALICVLIVSTAVDLEFWIIPLSPCWVVSGIAILGMGAAATIAKGTIPVSTLILMATPRTGALALGSLIGLGASICLVTTKMMGRSYQYNNEENNGLESGPLADEGHFNHRKEMLREIVFLGPIVISAIALSWIVSAVAPIETWWGNVISKPLFAGASGSLWGYFIGCAIIWSIRILGTLGFGKEAMGLGDVHLMGCVGAVIGAPLVAIAILLAAIYGAIWGGLAFVCKKSRQMPFGPFLSFGSLTVMIFHDNFVQHIANYIESVKMLFGSVPL